MKVFLLVVRISKFISTVTPNRFCLFDYSREQRLSSKSDINVHIKASAGRSDIWKYVIYFQILIRY